MDPNIKKEVRKEMRTRMATVTRAEQRDAARDLYRNLVGWPQLELFRSLLSFCSFGGELDPEMINAHWLQEGRHLSM
ncbi:MAG: hypothetical protein JJU11_06610, partial [Candidatus Sumerlaeia bacterium]|nr:hypothetical protein [Candidatus Sumerlaeia bacterium]